MAKAKKKLLPKDFQELLEGGKLEKLKSVFELCDVNARGGYTKKSALAFNECPDDLARWLIENGADISASDSYGETPLHDRSGHWQGNIEILLELGADVRAHDNRGNTPLHYAAEVCNLRTARILIDAGANILAKNKDGLTPLSYALQRCSNAKIEQMAPMAELLINADPTDAQKAMVHKLGVDFEFHRNNFNQENVEATSDALKKLYVLFDVPPVPRRAMHDGKSPIVAKSSDWKKQTEELWDLLVPSNGAAETVQGEVLRIAGRLEDELLRNGGINWNSDFKKMADALLVHVGTGKPLPNEALTELKVIIEEVKARRDDNTTRMRELAVNWIALNPKPVKLPQPDYSR
jgi:hypothetical protein